MGDTFYTPLNERELMILRAAAAELAGCDAPFYRLLTDDELAKAHADLIEGNRRAREAAQKRGYTRNPRLADIE